MRDVTSLKTVQIRISLKARAAWHWFHPRRLSGRLHPLLCPRITMQVIMLTHDSYYIAYLQTHSIRRSHYRAPSAEFQDYIHRHQRSAVYRFSQRTGPSITRRNTQALTAVYSNGGWLQTLSAGQVGNDPARTILRTESRWESPSNRATRPGHRRGVRSCRYRGEFCIGRHVRWGRSVVLFSSIIL